MEAKLKKLIVEYEDASDSDSITSMSPSDYLEDRFNGKVCNYKEFRRLEEVYNKEYNNFLNKYDKVFQKKKNEIQEELTDEIRQKANSDRFKVYYFDINPITRQFVSVAISIKAFTPLAEIDRIIHGVEDIVGKAYEIMPESETVLNFRLV